MNKTVSIIIPAYQEAKNLTFLLPRIIKIMYKTDISDWEILVVDTMQPMDNTKDICTTYEKVVYLPRLGGNFYGDAIRTGIQSARYDFLVIMDADGSHSPEELPKMLDLAKEYDLVIASRYIKDGKTKNPFILIFLSFLVNVTYRILLNIKVSDMSNSFRVYRRDQIQTIHLNSTNFEIVEEILIKLTLAFPKSRIVETPTTFYKRNYGKSKRILFHFALSYVSSICRLIKIKYLHKKESLNNGTFMDAAGN